MREKTTLYNDLTRGMMANLEALPAVEHRAELGLPLLQLGHEFLKEEKIQLLDLFLCESVLCL
jgi:hypothetical protein